MRVLPLLASVALLLAVADLVRRRRLREEFSWIWILGASGALVLSLSEGARRMLASLLGSTDDMQWAVAAMGLLFLAGVCLDLSTKVSRLANQQKNLAQDVGRLGKAVADLGDGASERPPPGEDRGSGTE